MMTCVAAFAAAAAVGACASGRYVVKSRTLIRSGVAGGSTDLRIVAGPTTESSKLVYHAAVTESISRTWRLKMEFDRTGEVKERLLNPKLKFVETTEVSVERRLPPTSVRIEPSGVVLVDKEGGREESTLDLMGFPQELSTTEDMRFIVACEDACCTLSVSKDVAVAVVERHEELRRRERRAALMRDTTRLLSAYPNAAGLPPEYETAKLLRDYFDISSIAPILDGDVWDMYWKNDWGQFRQLADEYKTPLQKQAFLESSKHDSLLGEIARMRETLLRETLAIHLDEFSIDEFDLHDSTFGIMLGDGESYNTAFFRRDEALYKAKHVLEHVGEYGGPSLWFDKLPSLRVQTKTDIWIPMVVQTRVYQILQFKVTDTDLALQIEKHSTALRLLAVFAVTGDLKTVEGCYDKVVVQRGLAFLLLVPTDDAPMERNGYRVVVIR